MIIRILEHSGVVLSAVMGFFAGMFAMLMADLAGYVGWLVAGGIILAVALVLLLLELSDRLFDRGLVKVSRWFGSGVQPSEATEKRERWFRRAGWIAFFAGALLAFIAGFIVPPVEIMGYF